MNMNRDPMNSASLIAKDPFGLSPSKPGDSYGIPVATHWANELLKSFAQCEW